MSSENAVDANTSLAPSGIREIDINDLRDALARGISDFMEQPTHLIFLCAIYPVVGLFVARLAAGYDILPLLFPLVVPCFPGAYVDGVALLAALHVWTICQPLCTVDHGRGKFRIAAGE